MSTNPADIARYALFGEEMAGMATEFLHIEDIPSRSALYDWVIAPHSHPGIFQLLMVSAGAARATLDGQPHDVMAPALICVPASCVHAFAFAAGTQGWVLSIATDLLREPMLARLSQPLIEHLPQGAILPLVAMPEAAARLHWLLADMAARMAAEHKAVPDVVMALLAASLGVAGEILGPSASPVRAVDRRVQLVRAFEALIDTRYRDHLGVADYAKALAVAPPTLTRACKEVLGKPPGEAVLDRLLLEAMRYLRHTAASSKQIADRLGFTDPAYFARFFKARSGMTPRQFRQSLTQRAGDTISTPAAGAVSGM
jgi:AraC family transcriptional activator of pobA